MFVFAYGISIITEGIKGRKFIHFYGRIREVTYVLVMFTPIVYGITEISWEVFVSMVMFFPVFYFVIEFIDRKVPDPKVIGEDEGKEEKKDEFSSNDSFSGKDDFNFGNERGNSSSNADQFSDFGKNDANKANKNNSNPFGNQNQGRNRRMR